LANATRWFEEEGLISKMSPLQADPPAKFVVANDRPVSNADLDPCLAAFLEYWRNLSSGDRVPLRGDIDPLDIGSDVLPHIIMAEREPHEDGIEGYTFVYRLFGTHHVIAFGHELTGKFLHEATPNQAYNNYIHNVCSLVCRSETPLYSESEIRQNPGMVQVTKRIMVPLSKTGEATDMVISVQSTHLQNPAYFYRVDDDFEFRTSLTAPLE
jgi:hypothetical protein